MHRARFTLRSSLTNFKVNMVTHPASNPAYKRASVKANDLIFSHVLIRNNI